VWLDTLDGQVGFVTLSVSRYLNKRLDQPGDAARSDRIVGRPQPQVLGDVTTALFVGFDAGLGEHLRPDLIEFGHKSEDRFV
jgi:hypothetical protein